MTFRSLLREEKTLIIACHEQVEMAEKEWNTNVFVISSPGNVLHQHNYLQHQNLWHYVEEKGCKQIILVGNNHPQAVAEIKKDTSAQALIEDLTFDLSRFSIHPQMNKALLEKALLEQNVIQQCNLLLRYDFIRKRMEQKLLTLIGILKPATGTDASQVYYNGVSYNHLISFN